MVYIAQLPAGSLASSRHLARLLCVPGNFFRGDYCHAHTLLGIDAIKSENGKTQRTSLARPTNPRSAGGHSRLLRPAVPSLHLIHYAIFKAQNQNIQRPLPSIRYGHLLIRSPERAKRCQSSPALVFLTRSCTFLTRGCADRARSNA